MGCLPARLQWNNFGEVLKFSGFLKSKIAVDTHKDTGVEDLLDFRNHLKLELKGKVNETLSFFVSSQIRYLLAKNTDTDDKFEPDFWEGYCDVSFANADLRIGKQIVRWGKTDEISPVDNINPQEFEEFFLPKRDERKIPIFMAKINYYLGEYNLQGIFIPFFEESHIPFFNSDWAAFDHLKDAVAKSNLPPQLKHLFGSLKVYRDKPPKTLNYPGFGLRVSRTFDRFDLALSYLHSRNTIFTVESPFYNGEGLRGISTLEELLGFLRGVDISTLANADLTLRYRRMNVWGVEAETTWGGVGIRAELAYVRKVTFADEDLSKVDKDIVNYVVGADYTWGENLYMNLQFSQIIVINYEKLFFQEEVTNLLNGTINKQFMQGFLIPELYFYWNPTDGDYYLNPHITYKYTDNLSLIGGLYFLDGERDTVFGNYKDNDEVYFTIKYTF